MSNFPRFWFLPPRQAARGAALGLALALLAAPPARADAEAALQFLKLGKAAIDKRQFADAAARIRKALEEDPALIEARYWLGVALDKDGDKSGAIQEFRGFLALFKDKAAKGAPSKEETRLEAVCRKRLSELAFGEAEFQRLEQALVDDLMKFAREWFLRDPASATKALQVLLQVRADHAEAAALLKKLGGAGASPGPGKEADAAAVPEPFRKVKSWQDLLATKVFVVEETPDWKYEGPHLVGDLKGGAVFHSKGFSDTGPDYAIEVEVKVLAEHDRGWLSGPVFGHRKGVFLSAFLQKTTVTLLEDGPAKNVLAESAMPPIDLNAWHRLGVLVRGNAVEVWLDGKQVIHFTHPSRPDFCGQIGMFQQRSKCEYRLIRIGPLD